MHEWKCPKCGAVGYSRTKDKPGAFIKKVVWCRKCNRPMTGTDQSIKRYSTRELL
jgi:hypothetical protein